MLDFEAIKKIPVADVVTGRYHLQLARKGDYANCACPLPTHKEGDRSRPFSINIKGNYWRCFSESCNKNNGGKKGGDCINFVAAKERISQLAAAHKLAEWFHITEKTPAHIEKGPNKTKPAKDYQDDNPSQVGVKYMALIDTWFDTTFKQGEQESHVEYRTRVLKALKSKLIESYRAGQKAKAA